MTLGVILAMGALSADAATGRPIELISQSVVPRQPEDSWGPALADEAQKVVFVSSARMIAEDTNDHSDVYLRDRQSGRTILVSVNTNRLAGDSASYNASISGDGRWVVFESQAGDLTEGDANGTVDAYARDLVAGRTILLSRSLVTGKAGRGRSYDARVSRQGGLAVFTSVADDLVGIDTNGVPDVFAVGLEDGLLQLVSVSADGATSGLRRNSGVAGGSRNAIPTTDGLRVSFLSTATNLTEESVALFTEVFQRDLAAGVTECLSYYWSPRLSGVEVAVLSDDGRRLAVRSSASQLAHRGAVWVDADAERQVPVYAGSDWEELCVSGDGMRVAYWFPRHSTTTLSSNLWTWEAPEGPATIASLAPDGQSYARGDHLNPILNRDGSRLTWLSDSTNLVEVGGNGRLQLYQRDLVNEVTSLLSQDAEDELAEGEVSEFVTSPDGRLVAFVSDAGNLNPEALGGCYEVFLRDVDTGSLERISVAEESVPQAHAGLVQAASRQGLSADGNLVLFATTFPVEEEQDTNSTWDVYLRNLAEGTVQLVSARSDGMAAGVAPIASALSMNGRIATFASRATNVLEGTESTGWQLYWRDLEGGELGLATVREGGVPYFGYLPVKPVALSSSGRWICFICEFTDTNRTPNADPREIWAFDLESKRLGRLERAGGKALKAEVLMPSPSQDVLWCSGSSDAYRLSLGEVIPDELQWWGGDLRPELPLLDDAGNRFVASATIWNQHWFHDFAQGRSIELDAAPTAISGDGRFVALVREGQVLVWNADTGDEVLASLNHDGNGPANGASHYPVLTRDGRCVVFESLASDLVTNDDNGCKDVFARDLLTGVTWCLSRRHDGEGTGDHGSSQPIIGPDGYTVVFRSAATDLTSELLPVGDKLLVVRLGGGDTDEDGLDDEWETIWFGGLERDGTGDFDGDGLSDGAEFRAGTNPRDGLSVLRVFVLHDVLSGERTFRWQSVSGRTYVLQGLDDIAAGGWVNLGMPFTAAGEEASVADPEPVLSHRFYRVKCVAP